MNSYIWGFLLNNFYFCKKYLKQMRIFSYNVNGIRAAISKGLLQWLELNSPDVICLQEIKATQDQIPLMEIEMLGYHHYWFPAKKKGYSGVAILSKTQPDNVVYGMGKDEYDDEGRFLRADFGDLSVVSVYHPSGTSGDERQDFKMQWLDFFLDYVNELRKTRPQLVISGDYNICHEAIDIHDPIRNAKSSGFLPEEREWFSKFLSNGYTDSFRFLNKEPHNYSWWSYRANAKQNNKGWRIDYHILTENLNESLQNVSILPEVNFSDHCPIVVELNK